jgi:nucleotide-binding universal stress UspA family protein
VNQANEVKILIPLDGSELAEHTLTYVHLLKPLGPLHVRLVSVLDAYEGMEVGHPYERWQQAQMEHAAKTAVYLEGKAESLGPEGIKAAETAVIHGAAGPAIIADAATFGADLVIISTHGRTGVARWRLGSVADKVVRGGASNTLLIGPHLREGYAERPIKSILVPLDGSDLAEQALTLAERYASGLGARLHLVSAVSYPTTAEDPTGFYYSPELMDSITTGSESYLKEKAAKSGVETRTKVLNGPAVLELEEYVTAESIDLVIMTTHGRGGLLRAALGSVTDRLIGSVAPVLVVRASQKP